ncbi:MAG: CBS domain-containing protein [Methanomicrobiaceae archaeon]|nr:CBS domain-containing protein [Methanomicrobiaceae archaeon]
MEGSLQIGTIFDIPVRLHWTFLLVIPLFAWIIGSQIEITAGLIAGAYGIDLASDPSYMAYITMGYMPYILGTVVALGLFLGVFVHELAHSLVARAKGIKIRSITLLILGGVASMDEGIPDPRVELPMALAGPLTSFAIGIVCSVIGVVGIAFIADPPLAGLVFFVFGYLGLLNIILFVFNLLPAFPMDGGRVLRAWLATRMPLNRATKIAADFGKAFAVFFGIVGFFLFNPILIIIAFFIYIGANSESTMLRYNILLQDVTVADAMSAPVVTVPPDLPVQDAIEMMYSTHHLGFPVVANGRLVGMVTLSDVHSVPEPDREALRVRDIMTKSPLTLQPRSPLIEALQIMSTKNIGRVPIVEGEALVGIVTRTDILRVMELKEV